MSALGKVHPMLVFSLRNQFQVKAISKINSIPLNAVMVTVRGSPYHLVAVFEWLIH